MKVVVEVKESKADFLLELLKSLSFVKVKKISPEKTQLMEEIKEAVKEVNLAREGKLKLKTAQQLLDEL